MQFSQSLSTFCWNYTVHNILGVFICRFSITLLLLIVLLATVGIESRYIQILGYCYLWPVILISNGNGKYLSIETTSHLKTGEGQPPKHGLSQFKFGCTVDYVQENTSSGRISEFSRLLFPAPCSTALFKFQVA